VWLLAFRLPQCGERIACGRSDGWVKVVGEEAFCQADQETDPILDKRVELVMGWVGHSSYHTLFEPETEVETECNWD